MSPTPPPPAPRAHRSRSRLLAAWPLVLAGSSAALGACVDSTGPPHPLVEETDFAQSLDVDLREMTRIGGGVYVQDLAAGDGAELHSGRRAQITYDLWLPDGQHVLRRDRSWVYLGCRWLVPGFEAGMGGMRAGGIRRIVVPARLGYGERAPWGVDVPPHSILVYLVEAHASVRPRENCPGASP